MQFKAFEVHKITRQTESVLAETSFQIHRTVNQVWMGCGPHYDITAIARASMEGALWGDGPLWSGHDFLILFWSNLEHMWPPALAMASVGR